MSVPGFLRQRGFLLLALLWLPAGIVGTAAFRGLGSAEFGSWKIAVLMASQSLIVVAPCGLPLALACRRLWMFGYRRAAWTAGTALGAARKYRRAAWTAGTALGAATVATSLFAGLFGPLGIAACAVVLSFPVWVTVIWLGRKRRPRGPGTMA